MHSREKMLQNKKRTGFVEARFASEQKGNFGSVQPKLQNCTRIQNLNLWPVFKIFAVMPFIGGNRSG
jgi:hypothetical protein